MGHGIPVSLSLLPRGIRSGVAYRARLAKGAVGADSGVSDLLELLLLFLEGFDFLLRRLEEKLSLVDGTDLLHSFLGIVPESDRILVLTLEPRHGSVSVINAEVFVASSQI